MVDNHQQIGSPAHFELFREQLETEGKDLSQPLKPNQPHVVAQEFLKFSWEQLETEKTDLPTPQTQPTPCGSSRISKIFLETTSLSTPQTQPAPRGSSISLFKFLKLSWEQLVTGETVLFQEQPSPSKTP